MKSYTDIEQSKKLAKILPLESADMGYLWNGTSFCEYPVSNQTIFKKVENIPCWSLAALLGVLPNSKDVSTTLSRGGWSIEPLEYVDKWWCEYEDEAHTKEFSVSADNPVDACYEMIIKLNELKMLQL